MTPRILVFQHTSYCHLGSLDALLAADGIAPTIVRFDKQEAIPALEPYDALIVLGGPMEVWEEDTCPWLIEEKVAIREWVRELDRPYLGICLGHQLLAEALGGKVGPARKPEVALLEISFNEAGQESGLFNGFGRSMRALQWHGSEVTALPRNGRVLGSSEGCPVAAMAVGPMAFGVQYHFEATPELTFGWATTPPSSNLFEKFSGADTAEEFQVQLKAAEPGLLVSSCRLYGNFMEIARRHATAQIK